MILMVILPIVALLSITAVTLVSTVQTSRQADRAKEQMKLIMQVCVMLSDALFSLWTLEGSEWGNSRFHRPDVQIGPPGQGADETHHAG